MYVNGNKPLAKKLTNELPRIDCVFLLLQYLQLNSFSAQTIRRLQLMPLGLEINDVFVNKRVENTKR